MRNNEKIDINLATEDTSENLSEEELAQQNYETALRYINIAEHMNKFEDQDKYYHRAIQYLKRQNLIKRFNRSSGNFEIKSSALVPQVRLNYIKKPAIFVITQRHLAIIILHKLSFPVFIITKKSILLLKSGLIQRFTLKRSNALIQKNRWNFVLNSLMKKLPS